MPFQPPPRPVGPNEPIHPPIATLAAITAPPRPDELRRLPDTQSGLLRKAWLLMGEKQSKQAVAVINRVLYSPAQPGPSVRALALYLRGHAFQLSGDKLRAREDLRQARTLAIAEPLQRQCTAELQLLGEPAVAAAPAPAAPEAAPLKVLPRSSWNAAHPIMRRMNPMGGIRRVTIHHTANFTRNTSPSVVATQIRAIQHVHVSEKAWGDIGYHYLIDPAGRVWEGRNIRYQGAHAGGDNNLNNVGICLLGLFIGGSGGQQPSDAQLHAMEQLVVWLRLRHGLPGSAILTHRELNPGTVCPGTLLQSQVNQMRRRHAAIADRHVAGSTPGGSR